MPPSDQPLRCLAIALPIGLAAGALHALVLWGGGDSLPHAGLNGLVSLVGAGASACILIRLRQRCRAASQDLVHAQRRLALAIGGTHDGIWDWDLARGQAFYSARLNELLGFPEGEGLASSPAALMELVHPEDIPRVEAALRAHLAERAPFDIECRIRRRDGAWRRFHARGQAERDVRGEPTRMAGALGDVSARHEAETALRASLREAGELRRALDEHGPVSITDAAGVILYANERLCRASGYAREELIGRNHRIMRSGRHDAAFFKGMWERIRSGQVWQGEICNRAKDGSLFWLTTTLVPMLGEDGRPERYIAVRSPITDRVRAEEAARQAQSEAEEAARSKASFLATMSHEIRTPMNGIIGMTGLLLDTGLDAEQREFAETVRHSGEALLAIINDILDFSKIEAGRMDLELVDIPLRQLVEESIDLLAARAQAKGLEIAAEISPALPAVLRGDPGRLRQVALNLLSNAVKFTERGSVLLRLRPAGEVQADGGQEVEMSVIDTGIGLAPEVISRLFQPFTQADSGIARRFGGTGLGLAISRRLCELMGGGLDCESRPGQGSAFLARFRLLPAQVGAVDALPAPVLQGVRVLVLAPPGHGRRILVSLLEQAGMLVSSVEQVAEAQAACMAVAAGGGELRVLLADRSALADPAADLGVLRASGAHAILLMVRLNERPDAAERQRFGLDGVLNLPLRVASLWERLHAVCGGAHGGGRRHEHTVATPLGVPMQRGRVLIAEDNAVNQRLAAVLCAKLGLVADTVANGAEAVAAVGKVPYDLILMDCQMPEMDGFEATRQIRNLLAGRPLPILALTANAMPGDREACLAAGMDDHLPKPIRLADLAAACERWLGAGAS